MAAPRPKQSSPLYASQELNAPMTRKELGRQHSATCAPAVAAAVSQPSSVPYARAYPTRDVACVLTSSWSGPLAFAREL
jgi:hypothetical protein